MLKMEDNGQGSGTSTESTDANTADLAEITVPFLIESTVHFTSFAVAVGHRETGHHCASETRQ